MQEGLGRPVQVVLPRVGGAVAADRPVGVRGRRAQGERLANRAADRRSGSTRAPPLMRALIRLAAERHRLRQQPSLLMDGWSAPILVREMLRPTGLGGSAGAAAGADRDYLALIAGRTARRGSPRCARRWTA